MSIDGFYMPNGDIEQYDYNALVNKPDLNAKAPFEVSRISINNSEAYIVKVPKTLPLKMFYTNSGIVSSEYASKNNKMLVFNGGYSHGNKPYGTIIENGTAWAGSQYTETPTVTADTLGITSEGTFKFYDANSSASEMISDGVLFSTTAWGKCVVNGVQVKTGTSVQPQQSIGDDDDYYYFISVNGRSNDSVGASYNDMASYAISTGLNNLFILDGGGSLSSVVDGVRLTDKIDGSGVVERTVYSVIYFDYPNDYREQSAVLGHLNEPNNLSDTALVLRKNSALDEQPKVVFEYEGSAKRIEETPSDNEVIFNKINTSGETPVSTEIGFVGIRDSTDLMPSVKNAQVYSVSGSNSPTGTQGYLINLPFAYTTPVCIQLFLPQGQRQILRRTIDSNGTASSWESLGGTVFSNSAPTSQPYLFNGSQWFDTTNNVMKFYYNGAWY